MSLKCLFGHKWSNCRCERCGKESNAHKFVSYPEQCESRCSICGKTRENHSYNKNGYCQYCGKVSDTPFSFADLTVQELTIAKKAVEIVANANKDPNQTVHFTSAQKQLNSFDKKLGAIEMAVVSSSMVAVLQAIGQNASFGKQTQQQSLGMLTAAVPLKTGLDKLNAVMTAYNEETARRDGSAAFDDIVKKLFTQVDSILVVDPDRSKWEAENRAEIDQLIAGGGPAWRSMQRSLNACMSGAGKSINEEWWYGARNIVRIAAKYPAAEANEYLLYVLELNSEVREWYSEVQNEALDALRKVGIPAIIPRLEKILQNPGRLTAVDQIRALVQQLKDAG